MEKTIAGDLLITNENIASYQDITEVTGRLKISCWSKLTLERLIAADSIELNFGTDLEAPALIRCNHIYLRGSTTLNVRSLRNAGSISMLSDDNFHAPKLVRINGNVDMEVCSYHRASAFNAPALAFHAPLLTEVCGDIYLRKHVVFETLSLIRVTGNIKINQGTIFCAPLLTSICGNVVLKRLSRFEVPTLVEISGTIFLKSYATLQMPKLIKVSTVRLGTSAVFHAPELVEVAVCEVEKSGAVFHAPTLIRAGISISVHSGFHAPILTEVMSETHIYGRVSLPVLTKSGNISVYENSFLIAPSLTTTGTIELRKGAVLQAPALWAGNRIEIEEHTSFDTPQTRGLRYKSVDDSLFIIDSENESDDYTIYQGYMVEKIVDGVAVKSLGFVAEKKELSAFGETIKQAIASLKSKIISYLDS